MWYQQQWECPTIRSPPNATPNHDVSEYPILYETDSVDTSNPIENQNGSEILPAFDRSEKDNLQIRGYDKPSQYGSEGTLSATE